MLRCRRFRKAAQGRVTIPPWMPSFVGSSEELLKERACHVYHGRLGAALPTLAVPLCLFLQRPLQFLRSLSLMLVIDPAGGSELRCASPGSHIDTIVSEDLAVTFGDDQRRRHCVGDGYLGVFLLRQTGVKCQCRTSPPKRVVHEE